MEKKCVIATRKSPLALWQAEYVKQQLIQANPNLTVTLLPITTEGDKMLSQSLAKVGGKGLFVKALEDALLAKKADIAVHSMKDVPVELPEGLILGAICERADPRDVFVSYHYDAFDALPAGSVIGTSSLRRQCQLKAIRPDIEVIPLRGNVNTRLKKLADHQVDGIVLAASGLARLGIQEGVKDYFEPPQFIPAGGQGALGIECRDNDSDIQHLIAPFHHQPTANCLTAERLVSEKLGGSCQVPLGAFATIKANLLQLVAMVGEVNGRLIIRAAAKGDLSAATKLGEKVAAELIASGAKEILDAL